MARAGDLRDQAVQRFNLKLAGDDDEQEEEPAGYGEGDFIRLDRGRTYIRKFEVVAMRWEKFYSVEDKMEWQLKVFFSDCPHSVLYGEEAADVLSSFGLPSEPPDE